MLFFLKCGHFLGILLGMAKTLNENNHAKSDNSQIKIAVGLSGGVDSSVVAHLLVEQGYDVTGVYMQCWDAKADGCRADEDRADAVKVASKLGIKFEYLDFISDYKEKVISYFYSEYAAGRTPNPDVMCNKEIKFGLFMQWALDKGFAYVATGHYARVEHAARDSEDISINTSAGAGAIAGGKLFKGVDDSKDQSYFLYVLSSEALNKTMFPLGELKKAEVRKIAEKAGLHTYDKADSTGICFIGEVKISDFLRKQIKPRVGNVLDKNGNIIGSHEGAAFYTIGQRHGFKIHKYHGEPMYVLDKNTKDNTLVVGFKKDCYVSEFSVTEPHWINEVPVEGGNYLLRIRHLGEFHKGVLSLKVHDNMDSTSTPPDKQSVWRVTLSKPIFGVAPGQSAVIYDGDLVLGGGIIDL